MIIKIKPLILLFFIFALTANAAFAEYNPFPENKGTIYEYDTENDVPDVCFFGEGARWDGHQVMIDDWNKLTDYQRLKFIKEAVQEIQRTEHITVNVFDYMDFLTGINAGILSLYGSNFDGSQPMLKFVRDVIDISKMIE